MSDPVTIEALGIDAALYAFVNHEAMPGTGVNPQAFWRGFAALIAEFGPRNAALLQVRDQLQAKIDDWHREYPGAQFDAARYQQFLREVGYLVPEGGAFQVDTANVDAEIAQLAAPQLVVPVNNARYALNAANARWGSLYDALYGSDVIAQEAVAAAAGYDAARGAKVISYARDFLDAHFALLEGSHREALGYQIVEGGLETHLRGGARSRLRTPAALKGFEGEPGAPRLLLLEHHGLHVEIHIDRDHRIGAADAAGISDVVLESALTTIQDCEDSVAAVDAADKIAVYRNWLGLMTGTLAAPFAKGGRQLVRRLNPDRRYRTAQGAMLCLPGRALMLVRNVGHHMFTRAVTYRGAPIAETLLDAALTALIGVHDVRGATARHNSRSGSIYIVKPKMHGPEEVAFAVDVFAAVETLLDLAPNTLKMGIMDEERRTSVNLLECIRAARHRVAFINTGFLDRTGDEIHTSMQAAAVPRKSELKKARWLEAYERQNVDIGLACGLPGHAQIGKGMWAMPDLMAEMVKSKIAHPLAGANTAWVPSPTAATLHALHYHQVDVAQVQRSLAQRPRAPLADLLTPPLLDTPEFSAAQIEEELNNNAQSILGYVVRWIDAGIGCSKVPDYSDTALMEDRATLRISSQHLANWLHHGVCTAEQVTQALRRMALIVDRQNAGDPSYHPFGAEPRDNIAFRAASDLIFGGRSESNGYTERVLSARRLERKALLV